MKYIKTYENLLKGMSEERMKNKLSEQEMIIQYIKFGEFDKLPRNDQGVCVCNGNLDFYSCGLTSLPDNLTVNGNLNCSDNQLTKLPENLTVNGNLSCGLNNLSSLPDNLKVDNWLFCCDQRTGIKLTLPSSAIVKGKFYN